MPAQRRIEDFVARVESSDFIEAIQEFYTEDATMQENGEPPRVGREALVAHERRVIAAFEKARAHCVRPIFVQREHVVIHWVFEFTTADGKSVRLDELARQRWQGDRIAEERFYYDPAQLRA